MVITTADEIFTPWYKEPWAWFVVIILTVSVCWGIFQLTVAFRNADSVVIDDYYKNGRAINEDLTRDQNAQQLDIKAKLVIDDVTGEVKVLLSGKMDKYPPKLRLSLLSPVFALKDSVISLNRTLLGYYIGQLEEQVSGSYYIQLETLDKFIPEVGYESGWRLIQKTTLTQGEVVSLGL